MESLIYFLIWAAVIFLMMRFGCGAHVMGHGHRHTDSRPNGPVDKSSAAAHWVPPVKDVDPVCHMSVDTAKAKSTVHEGHVYHFCSQDCRGKFEADPRSYLKTASNAPTTEEHHHAS